MWKEKQKNKERDIRREIEIKKVKRNKVKKRMV